MPDRRGRPGLLTPKHGDTASYILTTDPNLTNQRTQFHPNQDGDDGDGDEQEGAV